MKHLLLLLCVSLFLGCSTSSLLYQHDTVSLQIADRAVDLSGRTIYSTQQNLAQISIRKHLFKDQNNEILVYEYARLQTGYRFKYNYQYILDNIFDAKQVQRIKDENGLGFFTIELKDGHRLNVVAKTGTKKSLTMLYGFSEENFTALISNKTLRMQEPKDIKAEEKIKSRWNMKLIITGVLLEKEGARAPKQATIR